MLLFLKAPTNQGSVLLPQTISNSSLLFNKNNNGSLALNLKKSSNSFFMEFKNNSNFLSVFSILMVK